VPLDRKVLRALREPKVLLVLSQRFKVHKVFKDLRVHRVMLVLLVQFPVRRDRREQMVLKGLRDPKVLKATRVLLVFRLVGTLRRIRRCCGLMSLLLIPAFL